MTYNLYDYLSFRGDLSFEKDGLNPVDAVIFARLSYIPMELVLTSESVNTLEEIYKMLDNYHGYDNHLILQEDKTLLKKVVDQDRFKDIKVSHFVNEISLEAQKQFAAMVFTLPKHPALVTFRGTDRNLVGWKEDFNLSFMDQIPSQKRSLEYLEIVTKDFDKIILNGHSKGGNLALYSLCHCNEKIYDKIITTFNFDGPGLTENSLNEKVKSRAQEKVINYIPQGSIVGTLLEYEGKIKIVRASEEFYKQHDIYYWNVEGPDFYYLDERSEESIFTEVTLKRWIGKIDGKSREEFFESVYNLFTLIGKTEFNQTITNANLLKTVAQLTISLKDLPATQRKIIVDGVVELFKSARTSYDMIKNK